MKTFVKKSQFDFQVQPVKIFFFISITITKTNKIGYIGLTFYGFMDRTVII